MVLGLAVAAVVAVVAGILVASSRAAVRRTTAERDGVQRTLAEVTTERDKARAALAEVTAERDRALDELSGARARADEAVDEAAAANARVDEHRALLDALSRGDDGGGAHWELVLAHVARRWAAVVGVPPDARGVVSGPVPEQLREGLSREVERLREEVGVDVGLSVAEPGAEQLTPADPAAFLLSATEFLGVLAAACHRVTVQLDHALVLAGEGWIDPSDDLTMATKRARAAGVVVETDGPDEERVTVTLQA